jgi:cytoskeleton protein RodZ
MMEQQDNADQENHTAATPSESLGKILREERERLGLSVGDVAALIKFAPRQIEALEADDLKQLPEPAFLRGFVRSYAKILHLDHHPLLALLPEAKMTTAEMIPPSVGMPYPTEHVSQRQSLNLLGAALLLAVIAAAFSVWHFKAPFRQFTGAKIETPAPSPVEKHVTPEPLVKKHNMTETSKPAEPKVAAEPKVSAEPKASVEPKVSVESKRSADTRKKSSATVVQSSVRSAMTKAGQAEPKTQAADTVNSDDTQGPTTTLRLVFDEESWTEITDKDGKMVSSQINPRGSELNVQAHLPLSLVIGHAATTHLYQDGEPVDLTPYINSYSEVARLTLE